MKFLAMLHFDERDAIPGPLRKHTTLKRRPSRETLNALWDREIERINDAADAEFERRKKTARAHKRMIFPYEGTVPNYGDISQITDADLEALGPVDLLEGGSPCQAFSIAGNRMGVDDYRGNLMMAFCDLAQRMRRINGLRWLLWENVKGVLSDKENGFGCLLASLAGQRGDPILPPGKGWANAGMVFGAEGQVAWRLLDSKHFGVPQRRERVFALAYLGDEPPPVDLTKILFEQETQKGHSKARKGPQKTTSTAASACLEELMIFMAGAGSGAGSIAASTTTSPTLKASLSGSNMVPTVAYRLIPNLKGRDKIQRQRSSLSAIDLDLQSPAARYVVRRLLPVECERLQGFPDGWTDVPVGDEPPLDSWRYKAIGNSMSVPVMEWLGRRLQGAIAAADKAA